MELTSITPTPQMLRALAHPTRLRCSGCCASTAPRRRPRWRPGSASTPGQTSYHLRQLAQHGFVVDDHERGNGRDRWWKAAHQSTTTGGDPRAAEDQEALDAYLQTVAVVYTQQLQAAIEERPLLPREWRAASTFSDYHVRVTAGHARTLTDKMRPAAHGAARGRRRRPRRGGLRRSSSRRSRGPGTWAVAEGWTAVTSDEPPAAADRLPDLRRDLARRHPGLDDRDPVAGADHHRVGRQDRSGRFRRAAAAGRGEGTGRSAASTGWAPAGWRSPATC